MSIYKDTIPYYVYRVELILTNEYYFGYREAHVKQQRYPKDDLWIKYFTSSTKIANLIKQYGKDNFSTQVIYEDTNLIETFWIEQDYIKFYWDDPLLLNEHYSNRTNNSKVFRIEWSEDKRNQARERALLEISNGTHNFVGDNHPSKRKVANGTHPWIGPENNRKKFSEGNHPWLGGDFQRNHMKRLVENGTHNLLGDNNPVHKLVENGTHHFQLEYTCPHCGKIGKGPPMLKWHFDNCKKSPNYIPIIIPKFTCIRCRKTGGGSKMIHHINTCKL